MGISGVLIILKLNSEGQILTSLVVQLLTTCNAIKGGIDPVEIMKCKARDDPCSLQMEKLATQKLVTSAGDLLFNRETKFPHLKKK